MPQTLTTNANIVTFADLLRELGDIPLDRIRFRPPPGSATEEDVIEVHDHENTLCELVDGVLVEKVMALYESRVAIVLSRLLDEYAEQRDLGPVFGADGMLRIFPGLVRIPDVSFVSWDQLPSHELPDEPIPDLAPDLAVEVISEGNTRAEMDRKVREYFEAGTRLVWLIYPKTKTAEVYTSPGRCRRVGKSQTLTGGNVLPGFRLKLAELFGRVGKRRRGK